jgi:hypothetical protein
MSRQTLSLFREERPMTSIPSCPSCKVVMRLTLTTGKDGLEEYVYECSHCGTNESRAHVHATQE